MELFGVGTRVLVKGLGSTDLGCKQLHSEKEDICSWVDQQFGGGRQGAEQLSWILGKRSQTPRPCCDQGFCGWIQSWVSQSNSLEGQQTTYCQEKSNIFVSRKHPQS